MTLKERVKIISQVLDDFFENPPIPLDFDSPFTLLIAVLLSAQCTDLRVNQVTKILFQKANSAQKMSKLSLAEIEDIIKPCGLFKNKAKNILALSKMLVEKYNGIVPDTFEALEKLPGVGHKTASVIMSHIFKKPAFPVDTHIHRLAERWKISDGTSVEKTERDLKKCFPQDEWEKRHLQMIYFGRTYCKARGHKQEECPICQKM